MKHFSIVIGCLLLLVGCIFPGQVSVPVGQAALRNSKMQPKEALAYIESLLVSGGYDSGGKFVEAENANEIYRHYSGPANSEASLSLSDGCISLVVAVKKGTKDTSAAEAQFYRVLGQINNSQFWQVERGQIC